MTRSYSGAVGLVLLLAAWSAPAEERTEHFDRDPGWDSHNNRATIPEQRTVRQDFGYSRTSHAGGRVGEVGGFLSGAAEPAYYAQRIPARTFDEVLTASGTLACTGQPFHALIGFFNADTLNEWRTPNTIALRIAGRGDVFFAWVEYATARWRAGGDSPRGFPTERDPGTGRPRLKGFLVRGAPYKWSLAYDPQGNGGAGVITATVGAETAVCHLRAGHKGDGAVFNRFGMLNVMKSADRGGEFWLDDMTVNGKTDDFSKDPGWEGFQNRRTYVSNSVRPRFDFGYSPTQHARGRSAGELGGLIFRGDCRFPERMAYYGDRLAELTLDMPLRACGKVCLRRGVTDSTVLIGFFHATQSMTVNPAQDSGLPKNFLGVAIEGPSREGFYFAPAYRVNGKGQGHTVADKPPYIYPDGTAHEWTLVYAPTAAGDNGQLTVTLGEHSVRLALKQGHRAVGARFDRFGIITTWVDGNGQHVYLDDLTYTCKQD